MTAIDWTFQGPGESPEILKVHGDAAELTVEVWSRDQEEASVMTFENDDYEAVLQVSQIFLQWGIQAMDRQFQKGVVTALD